MSDSVNHPPHYQSKNGLEPIDLIEAFNLNFNIGNVVKYVCRHPHKDGLLDLKKASWYLNREIERLQHRLADPSTLTEPRYRNTYHPTDPQDIYDGEDSDAGEDSFSLPRDLPASKPKSRRRQSKKDT